MSKAPDLTPSELLVVVAFGLDKPDYESNTEWGLRNDDIEYWGREFEPAATEKHARISARKRGPGVHVVNRKVYRTVSEWRETE